MRKLAPLAFYEESPGTTPGLSLRDGFEPGQSTYTTSPVLLSTTAPYTKSGPVAVHEM